MSLKTRENLDPTDLSAFTLEHDRLQGQLLEAMSPLDAIAEVVPAVASALPDTVAPVFVAARIDGAKLVLTYSDLNQLDAYPRPSRQAFAVTVDGQTVRVKSVVIDAQAHTVTLKLAQAAVFGQAVTVAYTDPTANDDLNAIQDDSGNDAASLPVTAVTNATPAHGDVTAPVFAGATVNGSALVLAYTELNLLDAINAPAAGAFSVTVAGVSRGVSSVSVDANARTVTLTLTSAVANGELVTVAYSDPTGGNDASAVQDASGNDAASLIATAVTNNTADTTAPVFATAAVNGATLVIAYSEVNLLDATNLPATSDFAVTVGAVSRGVSGVSVDANAHTVTLTLSSAVTSGQIVTVAYTDPTGGDDAGAIQDASGNDAASLSATAAANNTPPASAIELSGLGGSTGFQLNGVAAFDQSGYSVSAAGDVNGDGFADLIVGANGADPSGNSSGASYVVFGKASGFASAIELSGLDGSTGFRLNGEAASDYSGFSVSGAGDVNGDGFADLIVGANGADPNGNLSGASYVVFGKASGFASAIELSGLDGSTGFRLNGAAVGDRSGGSVSAAGDVNGDGLADLIVGAYGGPNGSSIGASYVVFGKTSGFSSTIELSGLDGSTGFRLNGVAALDRSSWSVSAAGDVNGDGVDDLIVGALGADPNGTDSGASYVVFGKSSGFSSAIDLSGLDGSTGFRLNGVASLDRSGWSVSASGDVNGDGFADLIVGAPTADPNGSDSGVSYVVFGKASGFASAIELSGLDGSTGFRLNGAVGSDYSGLSARGAGDVNGDGFADLILGAFGADPNGSASGASYVVFGKASGFSSVIELSGLDGSTGFRLNGAAASDLSGRSVSAAGDVNGDGFADLVVGARYADPNGSYSGASYVVFGSNSTSAVTFLGSSGADSLNAGTAAAERFVAGGGNDSITGGGGADVFHGGEGDDTITVSNLAFQLADGGSGTDTLALSGSGMNLTLANVRGKLEGIEKIDLTGSGNNTLNLTALDLLNLADASNTLTVDGNAGDLVRAAGSWDYVGTSGGYRTYTQGEAVLKVDTDVALALSAINLSSLDGSTGFRLNGVAGNDFSGWLVSAAGDVNGDGFADLVIGAPGADANGADAGASYVVFGQASGFASAIELSSLDGSTGFRLNGEALADFSGFSVSAAGDVNGDGFADLVVGALLLAGDRSGADYVVFGQASGFSSAIDLSGLDGSTGFRLNGVQANDLSGASVSGAGDINGDGFADLIVGAYGASGGAMSGASYIVFGQASGFSSAIELSSLDGSTGFRLNGVAAGDRSGWSVSAAGDVNGDGFADLIVGAFYAASRSGASYVVFGQASGFSSAIELSGLDGSTGFRLNGVAAYDQSGFSVSAAGDVNGDGIADLIVGAPAEGSNGVNAGAGYVVFGKTSGFASAIELSGLDGSTGFRMNGESGEYSGFSVSAAGDINGDGFGDLIVGAPLVAGLSGTSYVVFGKASGFSSAIELSSLDGSTGFRLNGAAAGDQSGSSVSAAGDVNGDGFGDLIVGAKYADPNGDLSGASYVVFGSNSTGAVTFLGSSGADSLNAGTAAAERFVAGNGNDSMTGGGGADVFHGGEGDDTITVSNLAFQLADGGSGTDTLALSGSGISMTLAAESGRIESVEVIDLTGTGNNTLNLTALDVVNLSDTSNTLIIKGNAGDTVTGVSGFTAGGTQVIDLATYNTFTDGQAIVLIGVDVGNDGA